jgi:DNA-binding MarR family transcriptional regulator
MTVASVHQEPAFATPAPRTMPEVHAEGAQGSVPLDVLLLIFQVQGRLSSLIATESRVFNLTPTEALALITLGRDSSPVSGIARAVGIRPNGASVLVDRLRERRLVRRQRSRRDNRVVTVDLTDTGRELAETLTSKAADQLRFALSNFAPDDRDQLASMLKRLVTG